jgi:hypothetical protein
VRQCVNVSGRRPAFELWRSLLILIGFFGRVNQIRCPLARARLPPWALPKNQNEIFLARCATLTCMADDDKKPKPAAREFPIEVKVGRTKVTVILLLAAGTAVTVKETNVTTEPEP